MPMLTRVFTKRISTTQKLPCGIAAAETLAGLNDVGCASLDEANTTYEAAASMSNIFCDCDVTTVDGVLFQ